MVSADRLDAEQPTGPRVEVRPRMWSSCSSISRLQIIKKIGMSKLHEHSVSDEVYMLLNSSGKRR